MSSLSVSGAFDRLQSGFCRAFRRELVRGREIKASTSGANSPQTDYLVAVSQCINKSMSVSLIAANDARHYERKEPLSPLCASPVFIQQQWSQTAGKLALMVKNLNDTKVYHMALLHTQNEQLIRLN